MSGEKISISDLNKAAVLAALYNGARPNRRGFIDYEAIPMDVHEAEEYLKKGNYFDHIKGRTIKIDFSVGEIDPEYYDQNNELGAAMLIVSILRRTGDVNSEEIRKLHETGTKNSAILTSEHLGDRNYTTFSKGLKVFGLGLEEDSGELEAKIKNILGDDKKDE